MTQTRLFDLLGDFTAAWPRRVVRQDVGWVNPGSTAPDPGVWLAALNAAVTVDDVRTGVSGDRATVRARLRMPTPAVSADGWPFVLKDLPDVEFRIQALDGADRYVELFVSAGPDGVEVLLERLPVEIRLPVGFVTPADGPNPLDQDVGEFVPGRLDDLRVVYRRQAPTSVFVHVRLHATTDQQFTVRPAVPVSFGPCRLADLPCLAVHDFRLIPSPAIARDNALTGQRLDHLDWLRHGVEPWIAGPPFQGQFAVRALHLDPEAEPVAGLASALARRREDADAEAAPSGHDPSAEFVLDDLVVPFFSPYVLPVPRHITVGIRRRVVDPTDQVEAFSFENAPVRWVPFRSPHLGLLVESLFFRSPADPAKDLGLTFSLAVVFNDVETADNALTITLGEHYTLQLGYRRDYTDAGEPGSLAEPGAGVAILLHHEIGPVILDIMAVETGYSIGRALNHASFKDAFAWTVDLFISMPPTGSDSSPFRLRSLSGEKVAFAMHGVGWRYGALAVDGVSMPDGVQIFFGPVALVLEKIGVVAAHGASYLAITGGIAVVPPAGFALYAGVRDLRIRLGGGAADAPALTLGGFFLVMRFADKIYIEVGGHFLDEVADGFRRREFGLTGTVILTVGSTYRFSLDLLVGSVRPVAAAAADEDAGFRYLMAQVIVGGTFTFGPVQVSRMRALFARNMQPALPPPDPASRELRYLAWYRKTDPTTVPGDRRLAAWQPKANALAFGAGVAASFPGLSEAVELSVFVLVVLGDDERGLLVVGEVFLLGSPKPVALVAIEWDGKEERFSLLANVELTLATFLDDPPQALAELLTVSGSLYIATDPVTVAIGRLADQNTWFGLRAGVNVLGAEQMVLAALCFEMVDLPEGPTGFGVVVRISGGFLVPPLLVSFHAGAGLVIAWFSTGSVAYSINAFIEAGLRIVLFGFLRFGIEAGIELRILGADPDQGEARFRVHLETPWFLPDVTWVWAPTWGRMAPQELDTASAPVSGASALTSAPARSLRVHTDRVDHADPADVEPSNGVQAAAGGPARTFSLAYLQGASSGEAARIAAFDADGRALPVPTDATLVVDFSVPVSDRVGLGPAVAAAPDQRSGDLRLGYELVRMRVRRRPRYGPDRTWTPVEERVELSVDFTGPNGPHLTGTISPSVLTAWWDLDTRVLGATAAKRLLLNSATPFQVRVGAPVNDEGVLADRFTWPCCPETPMTHVPPPAYVIHRADFTGRPAGTEVEETPFTFSGSTLRLLTPARRVRRSLLDPAWTGLVAALARPSVGMLARAELDEDAAMVSVQLALAGTGVAVGVVLRDPGGAVVGERVLTDSGAFHETTLTGTGPIRQVELYAIGSGDPGDGEAVPDGWKDNAVVELTGMAYVGLTDLLEDQRSRIRCADPAYRAFLEGRGKLSFLPNHDYEVALTTKVTLTHPAAGATAAEVVEYAMFRTKGLPGLNAVERVGEEVEPHVRSVYPPPGALLYREEPVTLALRETMPVAVPLAFRPQGPAQAPERTQLLRLALVTRPAVAQVVGTPMTSTSTDWVVAHRSAPGPLHGWWQVVMDATEVRGVAVRSDQAELDRLAGLIRPGWNRCGLGDPRQAVGTALVAQPPSDGGAALWPDTGRLSSALVRADAPYVDRPRFDAADLSALSPLTGAGQADPTGWQVDGEGRLLAATGTRRLAVLGDGDWDHLTIRTRVLPGSGDGAAPAGTNAGVAVGLRPGSTALGVYAAVVATAASGRLELREWVPNRLDRVLDGADLPGPLQAGEAVGLELTVFDDAVRARVGEVVVEAPRGPVREGRVALVAEGGAAFGDLTVGGLELYRLDVPLSRYARFEDHIGSFDGTVATIGPGDLGPGTTTATVAQLWAATAAEVTAAGPDPVARDALLQRWLRDLGLPRTQDVPGLALTAYRTGVGADALLAESPEPLDLSGAVQLSVSRIVDIPPSTDGAVVLVPQALLAGLPAPPGPGVIPRRPRDLPPLVAALDRVAGSTALDLELTVDGRELLDLTFPVGRPGPVRPEPTVQAVEVVGTADRRRYVVLTGLAPGAHEPGTVRLEVEATVDDPARLRVLADVDWTAAGPGDILLVSVAGPAVVGRIAPVTEERSVPVRMIADLTSRAALLVPTSADGSAVSAFAPGSYRLTFAIDRARYETTDAPDGINRYQRTAAVEVTL